VAKSGSRKGTLRIVKPGARCKRRETAIAFNQRGRPGTVGGRGEPGAAGERGAPGTAGATGSPGAPDTPSQVLEKLKQVDGPGSALDTDLLDGHETAFFQRRGTTTACPAGDRVTGMDANGEVSCAADLTAPTGSAGGALTGTYPNPGLAQLPTRRLVGSQQCGAAAGTNQDIPDNMEVPLGYNGAQQAVSWPAAPADPCTNGTQQLVTPRLGVYLLYASVLWPSNPTGQRGIAIERSGNFLASTRVAAATNGDTHTSVVAFQRVSAGMVFQAFAYQSSGSTLTVQGFGDGRDVFSAVWLGP
jgi:hypothetical protein